MLCHSFIKSIFIYIYIFLFLFLICNERIIPSNHNSSVPFMPRLCCLRKLSVGTIRQLGSLHRFLKRSFPFRVSFLLAASTAPCLRKRSADITRLHGSAWAEKLLGPSGLAFGSQPLLGVPLRWTTFSLKQAQGFSEVTPIGSLCLITFGFGWTTLSAFSRPST